MHVRLLIHSFGVDVASLKNYDSIALSSHKIHDIAAVLRIFFREMPEPVIPFEMYEPLMEVQRNADLERNKRVEAIRRIILGLSPSSTALLCYLIGFLQDIEEHSAVNKMTVSYVDHHSLSFFVLPRCGRRVLTLGVRVALL